MAEDGRAEQHDSRHPFQLNVVDVDGKPVPGAKVDVRTWAAIDAKQIVTGEFTKKGRYGILARANDQGQLTIRFEEPPKGILTLIVETPGYGPFYAQWRNQLDELPHKFTMPLDKGWTVGGIVTDDEGKPVEGVKIHPSIAFKERPEARTNIHVGTQLKTNADGSWQFASVPDSLQDLTVEVQHPDFQPMWITLSRGVYQVKPNTPLSKIKLDRGVSISGVVIDQVGKPIEGALVRVDALNDVRQAKTDKEGRYQVNGCPPKMLEIVATAPGWSIDRKKVLAAPSMDRVNFQMKPGHKIRLRVVDENGQGIPKARIFFQHWRGDHAYFAFDNVNQYADEHGVWEWNEAPGDYFTADICRPGGMNLAGQSLVAREKEYVFYPPPALVISGNVLDAKTGKPIPKFRVIPGLRGSDHIDWSRRDSYDASGGKYKVIRTHDYPSHLVRIEAEGYRIATSREMKSNEGNVEIDFHLEPAEDIAATIITPSGKPAAGAKVGLGVDGSQISISNGDIDDGSTYAKRLDANQDGQFRIPARGEPFELVITHPEGFAYVRSDKGMIPEEIQLTPWARVEGTFRVGKQPIANATLYINADGPFRYSSTGPRTYVHNRITTGKNGEFALDRILPGDGSIGRQIVLTVEAGSTEATSAVRRFVEFRAGETTKFDLGGQGRPVVGKLIPPKTYKKKVLWNFATVSGSSGLVGPQPAQPPEAIKNDPKASKDWWAAWRESPAGQEWLAAYQAFQQQRRRAPYIDATVDQEGIFRIDDVPEGVYKLDVHFHGPEIPGTITGYQFEVPPMEEGRSDEALDLGTLQLK